MKAIRIHKYGGNDQLRTDEVPDPVPEAGDLLVKVRAASLNPVDFKIRDGKIKVLLNYKMPLTMGNDLSGDVVAVGAGVTQFKVGDSVYARLDKDRIGALAEYALVRETAAALKPKKLDHVQAASLPLVALTAWQALVDIAGLQRGQRVLIHAGSGGVGTFAIQLARHLGAEVATTVGARNLELVKRLGATHAIDYRTQKFDEILRDQDVVLDTQGGETLERSFRVVKRGGIVISIGGVPDAKFARAWGLNPFLVLALRFMTRKITRAAKETGTRFEYLFMHAHGAELAQIGALVDEGAIETIVDKTFSFAETREALAYVEAGRAVGKVVVKMD